MIIDDMNPDVTPEEDNDAEVSYRERIEVLRKLESPSDPGEIRERDTEKAELELRIKEIKERRLKRISEGKENH